jgi:hypothetical protein
MSAHLHGGDDTDREETAAQIAAHLEALCATEGLDDQFRRLCARLGPAASGAAAGGAARAGAVSALRRQRAARGPLAATTRGERGMPSGIASTAS